MKRTLKCSNCFNVGDFSYIGSRNLNKEGLLRELLGNQELWVSYFRCPNCGNVEVIMHPAGQKPDIPENSFKEVSWEEREKN